MFNSFATPWTVPSRPPLPMIFPRQEYWSGLPFPSPGNLPDSGIEPTSPTLAGEFFTTEPPGSSNLLSTSLSCSGQPFGPVTFRIVFSMAELSAHPYPCSDLLLCSLATVFPICFLKGLRPVNCVFSVSYFRNFRGGWSG